HERMCQALLAARLPLPAYEQVLKASHTFNLLDARRAISVTERQRYILRVRTLASAVARAYLESREALGFPLLKAATPVRAAAAFGPGGEPTRAALAVAESCGTRVEALEQLDEGKGKFLFFIGTKPGERAIDLLPDLVREVLDALPVPRRMHWGEGTAMFVRPVHWVVMLLGSEVVPATLLDTPAGHFTRGHRFHAPRP